MKHYPMRLRPVPKEIIWGGQRLKDLYGVDAPFDRIAEAWELTVRSDGMSVIDSGELRGMTLREYLESNPAAAGSACSGGDFPLLIKFIDAHYDLSVQVHPDDTYARRNEGEAGKTEMWYVIDAAPDAALIYGFADGVTHEEFRRCCNGGNLTPLLNRVSIRRGEVYFIPSGQIHAICRGALIAEIQQNSNITYRLYDYDRTQPDGSKRRLHIDKALDVTKFYTSGEIETLQFDGRTGRRSAPQNTEVLCNCSYFRVSLLKTSAESAVVFDTDRSSFNSLLFTAAERTTVSCGGCSAEVSPGDSFFIPAGAGKTVIEGKAEVLISEI